VVDRSGAVPTHRKGLMRGSYRGRRAGQEHDRGSPGTQEILPSPLTDSRPEVPGDQLQETRPRQRSAAGGRKPQGQRKPSDGNGPGTFDFLGSTHLWARSRKGNWFLLRTTAANRLTRAVRTMTQWCRLHRHDPIEDQHKTLCQKLQGHAAYYGITGNSPALARFRHEVLQVWRKWLLRRRRAWRARAGWFGRLVARYPVPYLRCVHSVYRSVANG